MTKLVTRVARAICSPDLYSKPCPTTCNLCRARARAAVAVVLEEAAKVAEKAPGELSPGLLPQKFANTAIVAAAIRAMKEDAK